jgi:anti-anti-sigma factor
MTDPLRVLVQADGPHAIVAAQGAVYFDTIEVLREALLPLAGGDQPRLVLDLSGVAVCDSSGLNLMVQTHQLAARHGGWLRLAGPQPLVRRALEATNLTRLLTVHDSVAAAVADADERA